MTEEILVLYPLPSRERQQDRKLESGAFLEVRQAQSQSPSCRSLFPQGGGYLLGTNSVNPTQANLIVLGQALVSTIS